jgi:hypothetical protein
VNALLKPGDGLLFMKVGVHARESLEDIIARKDEEIRQAGYAMWGYGGSTCHPSSMVQPFGEAMATRNQVIELCMEEINSKHFADPISAAECSVDGIKWEEIDPAINVRGSRYALVIDNLRKAEFVLPLNQTQVPIGNSMGRNGDRYIKGRVDKACLEMLDRPQLLNDQPSREIPISLMATLRKPYAVFLRGQR